MSKAAHLAGVASPCINVCRMDETTGWCEGCLRTLDEIAAWGSLADDARRQVLACLPDRRVQWAARHGHGPRGRVGRP